MEKASAKPQDAMVLRQHPFLPLFFALFAVAAALLYCPFLMAAEFEADATVIGQVRENKNSQNELPVNSYLGAALGIPESRFEVRGDARIFRDFERRLDDFDLYQGLIHWQPGNLLELDFGRQFVSQGFSAGMIDGMKMKISPKGIADVTVYAGIPRTVEKGDFNRDDGLLTGLSVGLKNVPKTNAQIHVSLRKEDVNGTSFGETDEILAGANFSYQLSDAPTALVYGLFEYDTTGRVINAGTAGADFYLGRRFAFNTEFNYFNIARTGHHRSILAALTEGPVLSGRGALTATLVPGILDLVQSYAYQWEEIISGTRRHGHLLDAGFAVSFEKAGTFIAPGYYFRKSYGGTLHGARLSLTEQFTPRFYAGVGFDFAQYEKITNHNGHALTASLWGGYEVVKGLTLSAGWELNRNVYFGSDIRGSFKIVYAYNHKFENEKK